MAESPTSSPQFEDEDDTKREGRGSISKSRKESSAMDKEAAAPDASARSREREETKSPEAGGRAERAKGDKPAPKGAQASAAKQPGFFTPTNVALLLAVGGLACFWKGWDLYRSPGKDFYSGSAWLFLIAFFMVTVSAFHFLGGQLHPGPGEKKKSLLEALVPAIPFFALYAVVWWAAWDAWSALYGPHGNRWMIMFFLSLAIVSWGVWYALRPPSPEDIKADRLPTRRVIMLIMLPFVTVYGMIWLAERTVTRP